MIIKASEVFVGQTGVCVCGCVVEYTGTVPPGEYKERFQSWFWFNVLSLCPGKFHGGEYLCRFGGRERDELVGYLGDADLISIDPLVEALRTL